MEFIPTDCLNLIVAELDPENLDGFSLVCKRWRAFVEMAPVTAEIGGADHWFTDLKITTLKYAGDVQMFTRHDGIRTFSIRHTFDSLDFYDGDVGFGWDNRPRRIAGVCFGKTSAEGLEFFKRVGILPIMLKNILAACVRALPAPQPAE